MKVVSRLVVAFFFFAYGIAAPQNVVRIDDSFVYSLDNPTGIQYTAGSWNDSSPQFASYRNDGTYHVSRTQGAALVLFFRGSAISCYADESPTGGPATIILDGTGGHVSNISSLSESGQYQFKRQLWSWTGLDNDGHQVVILNAGDGEETGLDFFEITPPEGSSDISPINYGPGAAGVSPDAIVIDDLDEAVSYTGFGWQLSSSDNGQYAYFQGTTHLTDTPGDQCTFTFNGTAIWYFTDWQPGNALVSIAVDNEPAELISTSPMNDTWRNQRLTWSKTGMRSGTHVVTLTHAGASGDQMGLDFFKILPRQVFAVMLMALAMRPYRIPYTYSGTSAFRVENTTTTHRELWLGSYLEFYSLCL